MKQWRVSVAFCLVVLLWAPLCGAGRRGPGKYCGVAVFDRWDGCTLYSGVYLMYVSEKTKESLRKYAGQAVQIDAKEVYQPINPGDGRIGKFEYANGGTIFLDEIESMPLDLQVKLLRVLHDRSLEPLGSNKQVDIDIRVIAATKIDLKQASAEGACREDLYYRLNVITLNLPTLRERIEDIPLLFHHYTLIAAARHECDLPELDPEQLQQLLIYQWPGNVRELKNAAERFVLLGEAAAPDLGEVITATKQGSSANLHDHVEWFEKSLIEQALE